MDKKKRILILSDSLALPRNKPEMTLFEETYPSLLNRQFEVHQLSLGGATIKEIVHQSNYYVSFRPDYVILQSGIVDCAYRAFPAIVDKGAVFSGFFDLYRRVVAKVFSPRFLRRHFRIRYTKPSDFKISLQNLMNLFEGSVIIAIGIAPASEEYEKIVPGITQSIIQYNTIIKDLSGENYISLDGMGMDCIMSDHHHINKNGHLYIYNRVTEVLNRDS